MPSKHRQQINTDLNYLDDEQNQNASDGKKITK